MATQAQNKANRENAKKSTGPRTAEGKTRSSKNALKHGLLAHDAVMAGEDPAEFDRCFQELEENIFPKNAIEFALVRQIADAEWRLRRITRIEAGLLTDRYNSTSRFTREHYPQTVLPGRGGENQLLGQSMQDHTQSLVNLARYTTLMSRNLMRALNMIGRLRADEARYRENIDPKTGAIHRPTLTDPDPYNTPDPLEPQPTRYEPPAAVAQTSRPIGFRANEPSAQARSADLGFETRGLSSQPTPSAQPNHESRFTIHQTRIANHPSRKQARKNKRTQSPLKSKGLSVAEARITSLSVAETRITDHETRNTPAAQAPSRGAAEVMGR